MKIFRGWAMAVTPVALVTACLLANGVAAQTSSPIIPGVYTCTDSQGRKLTADRPIPECIDREQKVLNPSGTVKAKVGPSLTALERAEQDLRAKREIEERNRSFDEKRRDRALLTRYANKAMHDKERTEALTQIGVVIQAARIRLTELTKQRLVIDEEMEFYRKDPIKAPAYVRRQLEENTQSLAVQQRFIDEQESEIRRVNARFDDELTRLKQLWTLNSAASTR